MGAFSAREAETGTEFWESGFAPCVYLEPHIWALKGLLKWHLVQCSAGMLLQALCHLLSPWTCLKL